MNFTEQFPVLRNYTYLNTASSGILSASASQWRKSHDEDFMQNGSTFRLPQADFLQDVRQHVARFFQGDVANTFLVPNFSFAFNAFLDGLSHDHKFLLIESAYPSINFPVESRGFNCAYAALNERLEENILDQIKHFKPTVLAFSLIHYASGEKVNSEFIKKLKEEYPDLLLVADGTQFCGTQYFNFETSGLDVLISSGYKWMLGGYGNGFILIKDVVHNYLYQERSGYPLPKEPFLKGKRPLSFCFEPGHLDTLNFGTLKQSILFLEELGFDFIETKIQTIAKAAKKAFADRNLLSQEVMQRAEHSSIFNIAVDAELAQKIHAEQIVLSPRGAGLRVSFHFYNNEQELERLLAIIDRN
jgi:selenocysteine lyase/cysteine desulfurase